MAEVGAGVAGLGRSRTGETSQFLFGFLDLLLEGESLRRIRGDGVVTPERFDLLQQDLPCALLGRHDNPRSFASASSICFCKVNFCAGSEQMASCTRR